MRRTLIVGTTLILGALVATPLVAQSFGHGMMHGGGGHGPRFERMCENRDAMIEGMLAYAEARLDITEAQQGAWGEFEQSLRNSGDRLESVCAELSGAEPPSSLPERMARMERIGEASLAELKAIRPAVEAMYAELTPEQKEIADTMMRHGRRMGRQ